MIEIILFFEITSKTYKSYLPAVYKKDGIMFYAEISCEPLVDIVF